MKTYWSACKTACRVLTRFRIGTDESTPEYLTLIAMPIVAALIGLLLWVLALVLDRLAADTLGLVIAAVGLPLLLWWLNRAKGLDGLISVLENWNGGGGASPSVVYWKLCAFQGLLAAKILGIGFLLSRGRGLWLVPVTVLSATTFAGFLKSAPAPEPGTDEEPDWIQRSGHWAVGAVLALIAAGLTGAFAAGVFAVLGAWLLIPALERLMQSPAAEWSESARRAAVELTEYAVIAVGVIYWANRLSAPAAMAAQGGM